ncbi:MAG: threonine/serine exporter family protein, partial [Defluviitaleaceae bacterium]|nr:threonine/serine exporter family protein [Defluviitaleaceae bacterium]
RILLNFGFTDAQVFVMPGMLVVTVESGSLVSKTVVKRISGGTPHLGKMSMVNALSRELATHSMSIDEFRRRLEEISNVPSYKDWVMIVAAGTGSFAFTYIINADIAASFASLFVGSFVYAVTKLLRRHNVSRVLVNVLAGLLCIVTANFVISLSGMPLLPEMVVFGSIIPHLPGVSLVSSMRDIMQGDLVSGSIGLVDVLAVAGSLAAGVLVGYSFLI